MATRDIMTSDVGSLTGSGNERRGRSGCPQEEIGGMSILKFGKSLPLLELFETFMITGTIMIIIFTSSFYTYHSMSQILKTEGGSPASINIADAAAHAQPVWIGVGAVILLIGFILYYLHRRVLLTPS